MLKMLPRHTNELYSRLERVTDVGVVEIRKQELLLWYGQQRVTVNIWRDLFEKWGDVLRNRDVKEEEDIPLLVGGLDSDVFVFAWGEGVTCDGSWFTEVLLLTRRPEYNI